MFDTSAVPIFTGQNYPAWKFKFQVLMMERGLWGFFDGTEKKPDNENDIAAWKKKDQKAFATLISRIGINLVSSVRMCIKLEAPECVLHGEDARGQIDATRVEELGETFMDLGGAVTEEDWILTLLFGLPEEWSTVIKTLDSVQDTWTQEMVVDRLLHEESRRRQFANESEGAAMFSGGSSGKKSTWSKGATKKSSGGSDRSKGNTSNGSRKYHYCGKAGHFWRECRKRPSDWTPSKARNHEGNAHTASGDADDSRESIVLLAGDKTNTPSDAWFLDTGATQCMTHPASFLTNVGAPGDVTRLVFGNDKSLPVVGVGSTRLIVDGGLVDITNVLHVPGLKVNLLSVTQLAKKGVKVAIDDAKMNLFWKGRQFTQGVLNGELYQLKTHQKVASSNVAQGSKATLKAWHNRLAHANYELVKELAKKGLAKGFDVIAGDDEKGVCAACVKGKMARKPFGSRTSPLAKDPLALVHMDKAKGDVTKAIQEWALEVCEDDKKRIKGICTDGGGEFVNAEFEKWMKSKGIKHDVTTPYTPQQNGAAEWLNHTLVEAVRSLLQHSKLGRPTDSFSRSCPKRPCAVRPCSNNVELPCSFSSCLPPRTPRPTTARASRSAAPRLTPAAAYTLHPHASHPVPLEPLFLVPVPPPLHPLPPQGLAPSGVSQVDPPPLVEPLEISSDSSGSAEGGDPAAHDTAATRRSPRFETPPGFSPRLSSPPLQPGAVDSGAETAGVEPGGAETEGEGSRGAATGGAGFGGAATGGVGSWGAATGGADFGGPASPSGVLLWVTLLEVLELDSHRSRGGGGYGPAGVGAVSLGGSAGAGGTGGTAGGAARAGGTRGAAGAGGAGVTSPRGATGAGGAGPISPRGTARARGAGGAAGSRGTGAGGTGGAGAAGPGGAHTRGATGATGTGGVGGNTGARGPSAARASGAAGAGGARGATGAAGAGGAGAAGAGGAGAADQSQPQLRLGYPLPVPAPHTEVTESLSERREPETRASTPVRARRVAHPRPPTVPGTHSMALCPSSVPKRVVLPEPPASSLPHFPDPESDLARASLVTESESVCPPSVGGEPALGSDVLEDRQFELECLAAALPRFASMLLCPEGDPDALDIPPPRALSLRRSRVLQRFGFQFSSPQPTPLSTGHSLSAPPSDESIEPSGPYPELVGCLICEAEIYSGAMAAQELRWLTYLLTDLGERPRFPPVLYVDNKAMLALCHEQRLEHRTKHIALCYFLARELQQRRQLRLSYVASRANTADVFTKALGSSDHQRFCIALGLVPTLPNMLVA
ncbi:unnamed protein product [Closterium sp. NIES-54]